MNVYGEDLPRCSFHPKQVVVGICSLCLRERLLNLASKQSDQHQAEDTDRSLHVLKGKLTIYLPRFYAVSSILHCFKFRHQRTNDRFDECSIPSQDSFISIKFDDDQHAPDGHERSSMKASLELVDSAASHQALPGQNKKVGSMEYVRQPGVPRWRKKIGSLFKFAKRKTCKERTQERKGWTESLK